MEENHKPRSRLLDFYDKKYKTLLLIPFALLIIGILAIGINYMTTGDFINKGVTLKGGITLTIPTVQNINIEDFKRELSSEFPDSDISVRRILIRGAQSAISITSTDLDEKTILPSLKQKLGDLGEYGVETTGPALGASFFKEAIRTLIVAFLFLGMVVFLYFSANSFSKVTVTLLTIAAGFLVMYSHTLIADIFAAIIGVMLMRLYLKYSIPSVAVIISAFSDIVITIAVLNIVGVKLSTAGIAALLMLIGYSVDTDILLSTRVLKSKEGTVFTRSLGAMKTGMTMAITTIVAVTFAYFFAQTEVIKQIMLVIFIGLVIDVINTWLMNTGILRWHLESKRKHEN